MSTTLTRILIVDDDFADRLLFQEAMEELDLATSIQTAVNGENLMELLHMPDTELPQLIFLDLNMPRKNGIECLKEIRHNQAFNDIVIIIFSTSTLEKDINNSFDSGATRYMAKPSDFNILKQLLGSTLASYPFDHPIYPDRESFEILPSS
ncbi:MAG: response regulator [Bacteroidia bacterium]|nr:response regulator [Bacteroidia bacterium]